MVFGWLLLALVYLMGLFWIAKWGDRNATVARKITSNAYVYSLALAIYCTAWTFLGAVGQSTREYWMYLPILLGPMLVYLFGYKFIVKLTQVSKKQRINTVADFIASRYGKRQAVALLVTFIALLATIPYIALQLKAIGSAFAIMSQQEDQQLIVVIATVFIAIFAIYFGTKQTDVTEYRRGLMLAISFESIIKLFALILVAYVGYTAWSSVSTDTFLHEYRTTEALNIFSSYSFWAQTIVAGAAVICLPRQFHVAIIDNLNIEHIKTARWLFPLYLGLTALVIPVIAMSGKVLFADQNIESDSYVLQLAIFSDSLIIKMFVFVGALSAATAMIIVATLTLSTMLANDVVLPKLLDNPNQAGHKEDYGKTIRLVRRLIIGLVLILSYIYQQQLTGSKSLSSIGLIAFSLVIQLLPAIVGGLYWKKGHAHGVYAGLLMGLVSWTLWLIIPLLNSDMSIYSQSEILSQGALVSLLANTIAYIVFSHLAPARLIDKIQAEAFVRPSKMAQDKSKHSNINVDSSDLITLLSTFMGTSRCDQLIAEFEQLHKITLLTNDKPDEKFISFCERALGGVIGSSSSQALINSVLQGKKLDFTEVINFFDDTTQAMQFNMTALLTSLESMEQGISVIDKHLNLVAWNKKYTELFNYPDNYLLVGSPIEKLMRFNAKRGELGMGDIEEMIQRRLEHLKNATPHRFTRQRNDGHVIEMIGNPLPGGGFVTSFNDITSHVEIQKALKESNIDLEYRMKKRTEEVHSINADLRLEIERRNDAEKELIRARRAAEEANASKTRFLALASHDIIQPLNAAKLYLSALQEAKLSESAQGILNKLNDSVTSSERLISTLLDISRLDQGEMAPNDESFELCLLIQPLIVDMQMAAEKKGLVLKSRLRPVWVQGDRTFTYRIIQNLLTNAIKYTDTGKALITIRERSGKIEVRVFDTGIGIDQDKQKAIFTDFYRVQESTESGVGLGLGVVRRLTQQMQATMNVVSTKHKGSCFTLVMRKGQPIQASQSTINKVKQTLSGLNVLCVDDKNENLDALDTLLTRWEVNVVMANTYESALAMLSDDHPIPDALLIDYQLDKEQNGLALITAINAKLNKTIPSAIVTALQDNELRETCLSQGVQFLNKPLKPAKLRAVLQSLTKQRKR
jgi:PAS domain S-box-containing protein